MASIKSIRKHPLQLPIVHRTGIRIPANGIKVLDQPIEGAAYDQGTITNGYGKCSGVIVTVQKGTSADINVDFTVTTVNEDSFNQWWNQSQNYFDDEQRHTLEENYGGGGFLGGFLGGGLGILFAAGDYNHYKNQSDSHWGSSSAEQEGFAKSVYNLEMQQVHVTGKLTATGTSYIPVSASAFVQLTTITFSDGKVLQAIDTNNPVAADAVTGDTSNVTSAPTRLTQVPIRQ